MSMAVTFGEVNNDLLDGISFLPHIAVKRRYARMKTMSNACLNTFWFSTEEI